MDGMEHRTADQLLSTRADVRHVIRHVGRIVAGLTVTFVVTRAGASLVWDDQTIEFARLTAETLIVGTLAAVSISVLSAIPIRRDLLRIRNVIVATEAERRADARAEGVLRDVRRAFDLAEAEPELFDVAGHALAAAGPGCAEILVADASHAHVQRVAHATGRDVPGCGVVTPGSCPAVREGHTLKFGDPTGLSACPRLRERSLPRDTIAVCVPINILGTSSAVLHAVCARDDEPNPRQGVRALEGVASRFGTRLGMIRAIAQSRHQADTDPLTGLLNRRAMENQLRELQRDGVPFGLAMVDLDHFKEVNDTFGHDTGDRALRLWARAAVKATRDHDIVARYGGEEFIVVITDADVTLAAPAIERLRRSLAELLADAPVPAFTFSAGLVDSTWHDDLSDLIAAADRALMQAKAAGRNTLIIDDRDPEAPPRPADSSPPHERNAVNDI